MRKLDLLVFLLLLMTVGCDTPERLNRLEKENQEMKADVAKKRSAESATADYDLQAKCSKDAKGWFNENWASSDKTTLLLNHTNHYNKAMNKCFVLVEYHYSLPNGDSSWANNLTLWDVYENAQYATFSESHIDYQKPTFEVKDHVMTCELLDRKCTTVEEFNGFVQPYLNN
jgi:hypothetical protein